MPRKTPLACLCLVVSIACGPEPVGEGLPPGGAFTSGPSNDATTASSGSSSTGPEPTTSSTTLDPTAESGSSSSGLPMGPFAHDQDVLPIWIASCLGTSCHDAAATVSALDLESDGVYTRICEGFHGASGMPYIDCDGGDPQGSYIFRKLEGSHLDGDISGASGLPMPPTGPLTDVEMATIEIWITGGAMP
ncbi:MAG: hypothetical protein AAGF11_48985 [Myxococcota bacterium]